MKEIGGFFELELDDNKEYYQNALHLNTGRNSFEYIIKARKYKKIYLPYYSCSVLLEPLEKLNISFEFYSLDEKFFPIFDFSKLDNNSTLLYINYFGICQDNLNKLGKLTRNFIIDNSQAFYSEPIENIDTFYSARKFFGVPDGAYLFINKYIDEDLEHEFANNRCEHLLKRIEKGAEFSYQYFLQNEAKLSHQPIKYMSSISQSILRSINYNKIAQIRKTNFDFLHSLLNKKNQLKKNFESSSVPMVYPLLIESKDLREKLIENKIYIAQYWANVINWTKKTDFEYFLAENLIAIPIDQRYSINEMELISKIILRNV